jgi:hypothetical protein
MADARFLEQDMNEVWVYARQARAYVQTAADRMALTRQEVQRARQRTLMACMASWMPAANVWTQEITATMLATGGLLPQMPPKKPPGTARYRPPTTPARSQSAKGTPRRR